MEEVMRKVFVCALLVVFVGVSFAPAQTGKKPYHTGCSLRDVRDGGHDGQCNQEQLHWMNGPTREGCEICRDHQGGSGYGATGEEPWKDAEFDDPFTSWNEAFYEIWLGSGAVEVGNVVWLEKFQQMFPTEYRRLLSGGSFDFGTGSYLYGGPAFIGDPTQSLPDIAETELANKLVASRVAVVEGVGGRRARFVIDGFLAVASSEVKFRGFNGAAYATLAEGTARVIRNEDPFRLDSGANTTANILFEVGRFLRLIHTRKRTDDSKLVMYLRLKDRKNGQIMYASTGEAASSISSRENQWGVVELTNYRFQTAQPLAADLVESSIGFISRPHDESDEVLRQATENRRGFEHKARNERRLVRESQAGLKAAGQVITPKELERRIQERER